MLPVTEINLIKQSFVVSAFAASPPFLWTHSITANRTDYITFKANENVEPVVQLKKNSIKLTKIPRFSLKKCYYWQNIIGVIMICE